MPVTVRLGRGPGRPPGAREQGLPATEVAPTREKPHRTAYLRWAEDPGGVDRPTHPRPLLRRESLARANQAFPLAERPPVFLARQEPRQDFWALDSRPSIVVRSSKTPFYVR